MKMRERETTISLSIFFLSFFLVEVKIFRQWKNLTKCHHRLISCFFHSATGQNGTSSGGGTTASVSGGDDAAVPVAASSLPVVSDALTVPFDLSADFATVAAAPSALGKPSIPIFSLSSSRLRSPCVFRCDLSLYA